MSQLRQHDFPRRLRALRTARGLTQRELAGGSLSVSYVSLLEAGRRNPTPETVRLLAERLGCSPDELTGMAESAQTRPAALSVRYGQLALEADRAEAAKEHFESALAAPDLDPLLRSESAIGLARTLERQGKLAEAAKAYESLVKEAMDAPRYLASLSVVISWCSCLYELGDLGRVVEIGGTAIERLDQIDGWQSDTAIDLLATVAAAYFELGDYGQAERLLREGLDRADRMESPRARAAVLWSASLVASERGRYREALELAEEALAYFRHGTDRRNAARLLGAYGYLLLHQNPPRPDDARTALEEALADLNNIGHGYDRGYVLTELSRSYLMQGDANAAVEAAERSLTELGPEAALERARAHTALAAALAARGDRDRSAEIFAHAARALGEIKANRQAARAWVELGNMLVEAGDHATAIEAFRRATAAVNLGTPPTTDTTLPLSAS